MDNFNTGQNPIQEAQLLDADPLTALLPAHRELVQGSAVSPEVAAARGYQSVTDKAQLQELGFGRSQLLTPGLLIPVRDASGAVATHQFRPDIPRNDGRSGKPRKYETPTGGRLCLDVPEGARSRLRDPETPLYITEGARKADSAVSRGLCCVALLGVWGWRGRSEEGGPVALSDWESVTFKGKRDGRDFPRQVLVAFDSDVTTKPGVELALKRLKAFLEGRGACVQVIYLPPGPNGEKTGLDDFFARGGDVEALLSHARSDLEPGARAREKAALQEAKIEALRSSGLPLIETNGGQFSEKLQELAGAIAQANAGAPKLFHGATGLVCLAPDNKGALSIRRVSFDAMRVVASEVAHWVSTTEREGVKDVAPPRDLCASLLEAPHLWRGVPPLDGIATAPFVGPDGSICQRPGYHASARLWLDLPEHFSGFDLPDRAPTQEEVAEARRLICEELLGEVAFADAASRAHAVALMLLPFVRRFIDGDTPLHLFDAPAQGSGKTHAARICAAPFTELAPTPEKGSDEEWRKSLICELATGPSHIFLDNITGRLNSSTLAAAITSPFIRERLTGTGEMVTASTRVVWVATSNNAALDADAASRTVVIRLDTQEERPESRKYLRDPLACIRANRGRVCAALLTLFKAWECKGRPVYSRRYPCRFRQWADVMDGILKTAGIEGLLDNTEEQRATLDGEGAAWGALLQAWRERHGGAFVNAGALLPLVLEIPEISGLLAGRDAPVQARQLGRQLQARRDRIFGGYRIRAGLQSRSGKLYSAEEVAPK